MQGHFTLSCLIHKLTLHTTKALKNKINKKQPTNQKQKHIFLVCNWNKGKGTCPFSLNGYIRNTPNIAYPPLQIP